MIQDYQEKNCPKDAKLIKHSENYKMLSKLRSLAAACIALILVMALGVATAQAKTVEVKLGTDAGMLAFEPSSINISAGDTVKFVNNKLAPHNAVFDGNDDLSHPDLGVSNQITLIFLLQKNTRNQSDV